MPWTSHPEWKNRPGAQTMKNSKTLSPKQKKAANLPDKRGYYGPFGGRFVPETLVKPLEDLEASFRKTQKDVSFQKELAHLLRDYAGRPTPLFLAERLSRHLG